MASAGPNTEGGGPASGQESGGRRLSWPVLLLTLAAVTSSSLSALSLYHLVALRAEVEELRSEVFRKREEQQEARHGETLQQMSSSSRARRSSPDPPHPPDSQRHPHPPDPQPHPHPTDPQPRPHPPDHQPHPHPPDPQPHPHPTDPQPRPHPPDPQPRPHPPDPQPHPHPPDPQPGLSFVRKRSVGTGTENTVSQPCLQMLADSNRKTFQKVFALEPYTGIPWQAGLRRGSALEAESDSILVREEGYYFVYSQVYYMDTTFAMGHVVIRKKRNVVGDEAQHVTLFRCIQNMNPVYPYNTCYTGGVVKLEVGDSVELLIPRSTAKVSLDGDSTFLGAVRLA